MKHLKRSLSLVLVLVMAIGMFGISANAAVDFPDADEITYTEAVDVLVGLGVFEGLENGKLNPTGDITREQAAKLIAYALLGKTAADALKVSADPFADVAANRWSAGYIAYCVNEGIINGKGDNKFDPTGKLTGIQFAKMLLCAVGYGVNDEFVGKNWDIEVSKFALSHGIFAGNLDANQAASISREVAALYLFNALTKVPTVKYSEIFGDYYTGSSVMNAVTGKVDPTTIEDADGNLTPYAYTLGYTKFNLMKDVSDENDAYGRPYYNWTQYSKQISDDYTGTTADFTYTGFVTDATLYSDLGRTVYNTYEFTYIIDGVTYTSETYHTLATAASLRAISGIAGTGAEVEVYINENDKKVTVIIVNTFLGVVTDVDDSDRDEIIATVETYWVDPLGKADATTFDVAIVSDAYDEGDYVLIKMATDAEDPANAKDADWTATANEAAGVIEGVATSYSTTYTEVGNKAYNHAYGYVMKPEKQDYVSTCYYYLDNQGNLIGSAVKTAAASSLNYLYVTGSASSEYNVFTGNATVKAEVVFADGKTGIIDIYVKNANKSTATWYNPVEGDYVAVENNTSNPIETGYYTYSVSGNSYTLTSAPESYDSVTLNGSATVQFGTSTKYATSSTKLVLLNSGKTYTGYKNFPTTDELKIQGTPDVLYVLNSAGRIDTIYIYGTTKVTESVNFAYYGFFNKSTIDGELHYLYADGKMDSYLFPAGQGPNALAPGFNYVGSLEIDEEGFATFSALNSTDYNVVGTSAFDYVTVTSVDDGNYFFAKKGEEDAKLYYFGDADNDCVIYDVTMSGAGKQVSSVNRGDDVVIVTLNTNTDDVAVAVYIVG